MDSDHLIIGSREVWGRSQLFGLSPADIRHHLYVIGQTGTGKSTLLRELMRQHLVQGRGFALIDPHGDLADDVLDLVPSSRINDTTLIEPARLSHAVAINPFYRVPIDDRPLVASNLVAAFRHLWRDSWGARLEYLLFNSFAAILDAPDHLRPTLLSVPRMLVDERYRAAIVKHIADPQVRQFWQLEFAGWHERFRAEAISPLQNKVGAIITAPASRNMLAQWKPTIDLARIMNNGQVLIVNLSKGEIGEDKANLIGSLLVASFQSIAMKRAAIPEPERRDFHLFLDEFHNFGTDAFAAILSEARKFALTICISHQYLAQTSEEVQAAVFGNVGNLVCFRVGADDAIRLARELSEYSPATLRGLNRGGICVRLTSDGATLQPFLANTLPRQAVRLPSRATIEKRMTRYARPREEIEGNIARWLSSLNLEN